MNPKDAAKRWLLFYAGSDGDRPELQIWSDAEMCEAYLAGISFERERTLGMLRGEFAGETEYHKFGKSYDSGNNWADWLEAKLKEEPK